MLRRSIEITLCLAIIASAGTARAQDCPGGKLATIDVWQGLASYQTVIASTGGGALVGWRADLTGWPDNVMSAALIGAPGVPPTRIGQLPFAEGEGGGLAPLVASGSIYLQVGTAPYAIGVRRFSSGFSDLGAISYAPYPQSANSHIHATFDGARFLVTYTADDPSTGKREMYLSRLDAMGEPIDAAPIALAPAQWSPWVQAARIGTVTWVAWQLEDSRDVLGVRVADDGTIVDTTPVVLAPTFGPIDLVARGDTAILIGHDLSGALVAAVLDPSGPRAAAPARLPADDSSSYYDALMPAADTGFIVSIYLPTNGEFPARSKHTLAVYRVSADGIVSSAPLFVADGFAPSITVDGDTYLVASVAEDATGTDVGATGRQRVNVQRFSADGHVLDDVALEDRDVTRVEETVCEGIGRPYDGCSAAGGGSASTALLVALALAWLVRRSVISGAARPRA
ncbi:MAG TPA: MYXO-CTERM sorting domain-containing protein [Kofleriaceae bacterium]|nr:MYXO-CTERM sorting domain-containing protein [Kofleriaceae bacterium]